MSPEELQHVWILRRFLGTMDEAESLRTLIDHMKQTKTNAELFMAMKSAAK